jgi:hypothetical protein
MGFLDSMFESYSPLPKYQTDPWFGSKPTPDKWGRNEGSVWYGSKNTDASGDVQGRGADVAAWEGRRAADPSMGRTEESMDFLNIFGGYGDWTSRDGKRNSGFNVDGAAFRSTKEMGDVRNPFGAGFDVQVGSANAGVYTAESEDGKSATFSAV